jgi:hypothetical protein
VFLDKEELIIVLDTQEDLLIKRDNIKKMNIIWEGEIK